MSAHKLFKPRSDQFTVAHPRASTGEHRGGIVYVHTPKIVFAVQVAQKTGRPLLLEGPAGSGKSSLASFVANWLRCRYYHFTVNARSQARDLMWSFDALGRLNDANVAPLDEAVRNRVFTLPNYVTPRALWWALDRESAVRRGAAEDESPEKECRDPAAIDPNDPDGPPFEFEENDHDVVLLIDEIDKADPDVPNNLLEALGSNQFTVAETGKQITASPDQHPLIMITTNNERELPAAFLRRCIVLKLSHKEPAELAAIAQKHFKGKKKALYLPIAEKVEALRKEAVKDNRRAPSTAEYLDAVRAAIDLNFPVGPELEEDTDSKWSYLIELGLLKPPSEPTI